MRWLAVDLGARRVGLAVGDEQTKLASPLEVIDVRSPDDAAAQVLLAIREQGAGGLLVGVPLNMDGTRGQAAVDAVAWGRMVAGQASVRAAFADERLSSFDAEQQLNQRRRGGEKLTRQRKKSQRDAIAAAVFLRAFLEGTVPPLEP